MSIRRGAALAGAAILIPSAAALAAAGTGLVAAATWLDADGIEVPDWLLGIFGPGLGLSGGSFYALLWLALLGYLLLIFGATALGRRPIWALAGGLIALFALAPPLLSQDVFSYIAYARLGAEYALNPYSWTPAAIATDPVFALVGWPDAVSVYGPLFTLASYALAPLSLAASLWTLKAVTAIAVGCTAVLCERIATWRGLDGRVAVVIVALNPLVLVHVLGGAHNDALMMLALVASIAWMLSARPVAGGAMLAAAVGIKLSAAFAAPFALLGSLRDRRAGRFIIGAAVGGAAIILVGLAVFGSAVVDSLTLVGDNQGATSRYSLPATTSRIVGADLDFTRTLFLGGWAIAIIGLLAWTWRGADWVRAAGWAGLVTLIATGWLLPWYLIWLLPLVAIARDRALLLLTLALTAFQLISRIPF